MLLRQIKKRSQISHRSVFISLIINKFSMTVVRALSDVITAFNWAKLCVDHNHFEVLSITKGIYYQQSDAKEFFKMED